MPVKTWVGRFAIVNGQPQEESALLRSFPRQRPDEDEDELFVLVEPASPGGREYCAQLVDAIGRLYGEDSLSITGAVQRALRAAHAQLVDWNARSLPEHQVAAGVSCLAVRGRTAYLAQVGPTAAFHVGDGRYERIAHEEESLEPLGRGDHTEPTFARYDLAPGDQLVIASPGVDDLIDDEGMRSILLSGADDALVELFRLSKGQQEFSLVLLACVVEAEEEVAPAAVPPPPHVEEAAEPVPDDMPAEATPAAASTAAAAAAAAAAAEAPATPMPGLSTPPVGLKGEEANVRYRRTTGIAGNIPRIPPIAIAAAVVLVVIGLIAFFVIPSALNESRNDQYETAVADAQALLQLALESDDPAAQREALRAADLALQEAERARPGEAEVRDLAERVAGALAELNAVLDLPELERVVDLSEQVPGAVSPKDLALGGGGAYLIDREQGRVLAVALVAAEPEPFVLYQTGDLVGTEIGGEPQHIAWAEDLGALLILDDERRLIAITPPAEAGQLLTVRGAADWGSANGIADIDANLYVLDSASDHVWRYPPSEGGFDSEREALVSSIDLEDVLEFAVGDALYIMLGDGSIVTVQGGSIQPFAQAGLDEPMSSPASLVPLDASNALLVADRGNNRIVVFSLDGTFLQQYKSPTFTDLRAIAVDEAGGLLYMLVGGALYRTPLPEIP